MSPRKRRPGEKFRSLYLWHRYAGLTAALLAIWLAVTGIVLNHTDDLGLANAFVQQRWLLAAYRIEPPRELRGRRVAGRWITETGGRVYLDDRFMGTGRVTGAAETGFGFVVGSADTLRLFAPDGELIEEVPFTVSTAPITRLYSLADGGVGLVAGGDAYRTDPEITRFTRDTGAPATVIDNLQELPASLEQAIAGDVLAHSLSWERVLLDTHSGRIFGRAGVWIADLAGMLLLLLAVTGVIVWIQRARARQRHRHNQ